MHAGTRMHPHAHLSIPRSCFLPYFPPMEHRPVYLVLTVHQHLFCLTCTRACVCVFVCRFEHRFGVVRIPLQEKLFVEPRKHCKTMAQPRSCSSPDKLVCVPQLSFEPLGLPLFLLQAHQTCALVSRSSAGRCKQRALSKLEDVLTWTVAQPLPQCRAGQASC